MVVAVLTDEERSVPNGHDCPHTDGPSQGFTGSSTRRRAVDRETDDSSPHLSNSRHTGLSPQ